MADSVGRIGSSEAPAPCAMCGAVRRFGATGILCDSLSCAWHHAALAPQQKCRVCTRPLDAASMAGVCSSAVCRAEWFVRRPAAAAASARQALVAAAERRRDRSAARRGIGRGERQSYALTILPHIDARASRLPGRRRAAFEQHLRAILAEARERLASGDAANPRYAEPVLPTRSPATQAAEIQLIGVGCTGCRGLCCGGGADHAYHDVETMMQYLVANPGDDDDTIVTRYVSRIGARTLTNSCLFHQDTGCSLPRELRSDTCNSFYCTGMRMIRHTFGEGDPVRAYFVYERDQRLTGGRFVEITRAKSEGEERNEKVRVDGKV